MHTAILSSLSPSIRRIRTDKGFQRSARKNLYQETAVVLCLVTALRTSPLSTLEVGNGQDGDTEKARLAAWVFTIGALWLATSAPFFQGPALHW